MQVISTRAPLLPKPRARINTGRQAERDDFLKKIFFFLSEADSQMGAVDPPWIPSTIPFTAAFLCGAQPLAWFDLDPV